MGVLKSMFSHKSVFLNEAVDGLNIKTDGIYVDCTLGGAGHSEFIASKLQGSGRLISFDQDEDAIKFAKERLKNYEDKVILVKANFKNVKHELNQLGIFYVDGILFDLGVSSPQLDVGDRGFSYSIDAPLDMRMDRASDLTASDVVNYWDEEKIAEIIFKYGEERFAKRIARNISDYRKSKKIEGTIELAEIIKNSIPAATRRTGPHPARRTFQAIRIAVNDELNILESALEDSIELLNIKGRISVITFHSLEDRICKKTFVKHAQGCICPPDFPVCTCNKKPSIKIITRKPIIPSPAELEGNPRSRSAKLRIAEKLI